MYRLQGIKPKTSHNSMQSISDPAVDIGQSPMGGIFPALSVVMMQQDAYKESHMDLMNNDRAIF